MISYQVLCSVPHELEDEWIQWMLGEHIRDVMNTEMFYDYTIHKVLKPEQEGITDYCIRYDAESFARFDQYRQDFAPVLQAASKAKFGERIAISRIVMEKL